MIKITLIVAAGGRGDRFKKTYEIGKNDKIKKTQTKMSLSLFGQSVLSRSIALFNEIPQVLEVIVPAPASEVKKFRKELKAVSSHPLKVVAGGKTRAESVFKALRFSSENTNWIMVHDGARPLCSTEDVKKLITAIKGYDGAILASKLVATVKEVALKSSQVLRTLDRSRLYAAETPQLVNKKKLTLAYSKLEKSLLQTDDSGLLEQIGARINIVESQSWNPKITVKQDAELAEVYLRKDRKRMIKTGIGQDTHRLVKGNPFYLGGLQLDYPKGPLGHSDGDALLHAIIDAILGATAMGDIGDWFSDQDKKFKNIRSEKLLSKVLDTVKQKGWQLAHVDTVITLQNPKLGKFKQLIKENLMNLLELQSEQVSVKAKTAEGLGPEGIGQAVTCLALVTMEKKE